MATGGTEKNVKIFDKRESKIVKTFDGIHKGNNFLFNMRASAESPQLLEMILSLRTFIRLISTSIKCF